MSNKFEYKEHDKTFTVNDNDPDLNPITIKLPSPPALRHIEGYGKRSPDQVFQYEKYPPRLKRLEDRTRSHIMKVYEKKRDQVFTEQKYVAGMWEVLEKNKDEYEKEIEWIKSQIYHALYGKWYFINGKPTYITEDHWFYLNYWSAPDCEIFDYRDRDRRIFLFAKYIWNTHEDEKGNDIGARTFYGFLYPKHRRDGATHKFLTAGYRDTLFKVGGHFGMQSFDEMNSAEHYKNKLLKAWQKFPFFFRPIWKGTSAPVSGMQWVENPLVDCPVMNTKFTYANSAGRKFYEGDYLTYLQVEEAGKTVLEDVSERWGVQKECLGRADGAVIIGRTVFPTTVYELEGSGGKEFKILSDESDFYERIPGKSQTSSGMARIFISAEDGLEGFIGPYGESVIDTPTPAQARHIKRQIGAREWLVSAEESLLRKGDVESLSKYRERKRLYPRSYSDCFISNEGGTDFNMQILTNRKAELSRLRTPLTVRGNFYWMSNDGVPMTSGQIIQAGLDISKLLGRVIFEVDEINGRWELLDTKGTNRRIRKDGHWFPGDPKHTLGADPFKFTVTPTKSSKHLGRSKGGGAVVRNRDFAIDPVDKEVKDWETGGLVAYYVYRAGSDDEYVLDMLMCAIFYSSMIFPETNVDGFLKSLIAWKYAGYLLFATDPVTGKIKDTPGMSTQTKSKEQIFQVLNRYIEFHGHKESFMSFVTDCIDINSSDQLKFFDGLVAAGYALIGAESSSNLTPDDPESENFDLGRAFQKKKYR